MKVYVLCQQHTSDRNDWMYEAVFASKTAALRYGQRVLRVDEETWVPYAYGGWVSPWRKVEEFKDFQYRWVLFEEDLTE